MDLLTLVRVVAVVCTGLLAGIYLGDRAGASHARAELNASSLVQFQQVVHVHFVRMMPPLVLAALLGAVAWLWLVWSHGISAEFWLIAASICGIVVVAGLTRAVNVPLNKQLMTWRIADSPPNLRELWAPWERVNTIRSIVTAGVLILEVVALSLRAANGGS